MVNYGTDLVVMGGYSDGSFSSSFYQLSVENSIFQWEKMKQELKIPRMAFAAMTVPDSLLKVQLRPNKHSKAQQPKVSKQKVVKMP